MKVKIEETMLGLEEVSQEIDKLYAAGVVDGFSKEFPT